ncbi:hypothetical protein AHAS_Ahas20G0117900 [Arachis hypogaea]
MPPKLAPRQINPCGYPPYREKLSSLARDRQPLDTWEYIQRYVKCHIFCLLGTTLFKDKSTAYNHARFTLTVRGQQLSHIFTCHCAVHHGGVIIHEIERRFRRPRCLLVCLAAVQSDHDTYRPTCIP